MATTPISNMTTEFTGGTTQTALKMNVTDTSSAADSKLIDLQVGGTSQFAVEKDGDTTVDGDLTCDNLTSTGIDDNATSTAITIDGSQNVGIGTSSPTAPITGRVLHVENASDRASVYVARTTTSVSDIETYAASSTAGVQTVGAHPLILGTSSTERMRIDSSGSVGIGTTSADGKLHVQSATAGTVTANAGADELTVESGGAGGISVLTPDASNASVYLGSPSDSIGAMFQWNYDSKQLRFGTNTANGFVRFDSANGTERMRIDSSGNVGIGTASADSKVHIVDAVSGGQLMVASTETNSADKYGSFVTQHYTNSEEPAHAIAIGSTSTGNEVFIGGGFGEFNAATGLRFYTAANATTTIGTERMRIDSSGSVGIGTTSPDKTLHVSGEIAIVANAPYLHIQESDQAVDQKGWSIGGSSGSLVFSTRDDSYTSNSVKQAIDRDGNVGIGGSSAGASSAGNLHLFNGTAPTGSVTNGVILYSEDVSSSAELKVRDEAGNVTTLSPHNFDLIPEGPSEHMAWSYYSERDGKRINVDMLKALRVLEQLSGEKLVHEETV